MINTIGRLWDNDDAREYYLEWDRIKEEDYSTADQPSPDFYIDDGSRDPSDYQPYDDKDFDLEEWYQSAQRMLSDFAETMASRSFMYIDDIADAWALSFNLDYSPIPNTIEGYQELKLKYLDLLKSASLNMELKAEISRLNYQNKWKIIEDTMSDRIALYDALSDVYLQDAPQISLRTLVTRNDFIVWLSKMNMQVDRNCLLDWWLQSIHMPILINTVQAKPDKEVYSKPEDTQNKKETKKIRKNQLERALEAAMTELVKDLGRKPSYEEVMNYLDEREATYAVFDQNDMYVMWIDSKNKEQQTPITTVRKLLARL